MEELQDLTIGFVGGAIVGGISVYAAQKAVGPVFCDEDKEKKKVSATIPQDCETIYCFQNDVAMKSLIIESVI